jgi:hypothetical protein
MKVYIITVVVNHKKRYLWSYNVRSADNKLIPTTSTRDIDAMKFATKELAVDIKDKILNHYNYDYKVEPLEVDG